MEGFKNLYRALIDSFNETDNTVEVVAATNTPVRRYDWQNDRYFDEVLDFKDGSIRMERMNAGLSVVDSHNTWGVNSILGVSENARVEGDKLLARVKLSVRKEMEGIVSDIKQGIIKNISCGYRVFKYQVELPAGVEVFDPEKHVYVYRAFDWEPTEISFVPVPADHNSTTRGKDEKDLHKIEILNIINKKREMAENSEKPDTTEGGGAGTGTPAPTHAENGAGGAGSERTQQTTDQERKRTLDIMSVVRKAGLDTSVAEKMIADGVTIDQARAQVIDKWAENGGGRTLNINVGEDDRSKKRGAMEEALAIKTGLVNDNPKNEYRGMPLLRMAEEILVVNDVNVRGWSKRQIAERAMSRSYMSSSDFPNILGATVNKSLRAAYELAPRTFTQWAKKSTNPDFKEVARVQLSGLVGKFDEIGEGGEYKKGKLTDAVEKYGLKKYGKIIPITWEAIINDDLSALSRIPQAIAAEAAQLQSDIVYAILTANPTMADGKAVFHADHKNLTSSGTAIGIESLSAARAMIRKQKSIEGRVMNLAAKHLIVGSDLELIADQYTSAVYTPNEASKTNPTFNRSLTPIVEPRLDELASGKSWFLVAGNGSIDTVEYAFLEGEGELFTEEEQGFNIDGMQIKARMVFAAKALDYRGFYKNVGA